MKAQTPENWEVGCVICAKTIVIPICADCLEKELEQWLVSKDYEMVPLVRGVSDFFKNDIKRINCIICGSVMSVCAHCYLSEIYELLLQKDLDLAQEFVEYFNFELEGFLAGAG